MGKERHFLRSSPIPYTKHVGQSDRVGAGQPFRADVRTESLT